MSRSIATLLLIILSVLCVKAQDKAFYIDYDWDQTPNYRINQPNNDGIMAMKDKTVVEFIYDTEGNLNEYFLQHKAFWLDSDEKIEAYNKVYIPYSSNSELIVNKARVISKNGTVNVLDASKILTATDEETQRVYKYFAFEGVEKGSFIEYFYTLKRPPSYSGRRLALQDSYQKNNISFDLYAPSNLLFKFKCYNGLPEVVQDTLVKNKAHWKLDLNTLDKIEKEEISAHEALRKSLIYKLDANTANKRKNVINYANVSQNVYKFYYESLNKKTDASLEKFLEEADIKNKNDEISKIRTIENHIKSNIFISEVSDDLLENLDEILEKRVANSSGIIKLFVAALRKTGIKHEIVLTSDRTKLKFDKSFESNNFLTDYLIYFPGIKLFTSPDVPESRLGFPPFNLTDNFGLFIKEVNIGGYKNAVGKIKYIQPTSAKQSFDNLNISVAFNEEDLTETKLQIKREMGGYYASYIQPFLPLMEEEDKDNFIDNIIKFINEDIKITTKEVLNDRPNDFGLNPLKINAEVTSEYFVEKAGNKYLLKVGELIGPQVALYQEKERTLPVESDFNRIYNRTIELKIPEGYTIKNLEELVINNHYKNEEKTILAFISNYKLSGQLLTIEIKEFYDQNILDVSLYEKYRIVINSAADFNKIVLVLSPS